MKIFTFSLIALDPTDRLRNPPVSLFFMICWWWRMVREVQENLFDIEFVCLIGWWLWSFLVVGFCRLVSACISSVCGLRRYFTLLYSCSEPGLHFDWRGFIARWFVIGVFRFAGRGMTCWSWLASCGCKISLGRLYKPSARKPWLNGLPRACTD